MAGIDFDDVYDLLSAWLAGRPAANLVHARCRRCHRTEGLVLVGRTDDGRPLLILARIDGKDIYVINAFHPTPELVADFEHWEARND